MGTVDFAVTFGHFGEQTSIISRFGPDPSTTPNSSDLTVFVYDNLVLHDVAEQIMIKKIIFD
jgi:hypothetical protein